MRFFVKTNTLKTDKKIKDSQIVCISDLHYTKNIGKEFLEALNNQINYLSPDYICFLGDLCDDESYNDIIGWLNSLAKIAPIYFIYGNHDIKKYKINDKTYNVKSALPSDVKKEIKNIDNLTVLKDNKSVTSNNFNFIGLNFFHSTNISSCIHYMNRNIPYFEEDNYNILLSHNPKIMESETFNLLNDEYKNNIDCILSGHTHNGLVPSLFLLSDSNRGLYIKDKGIFPDYVRGTINTSLESNYTGIICSPLTTLPDRNVVLRKANEIIYKPGIQLVRIKKEN